MVAVPRLGCVGSRIASRGALESGEYTRRPTDRLTSTGVPVHQRNTYRPAALALTGGTPADWRHTGFLVRHSGCPWCCCSGKTDVTRAFRCRCGGGRPSGDGKCAASSGRPAQGRAAHDGCRAVGRVAADHQRWHCCGGSAPDTTCFCIIAVFYSPGERFASGVAAAPTSTSGGRRHCGLSGNDTRSQPRMLRVSESIGCSVFQRYM